MKITTLTMLCIVSTVAWAGDAVRLSDPVDVRDGHEIYGAPMNTLEADLTLTGLLSKRDELSGKPVRLTTEIAQVCQKKGCFFIAREGEHVARVTFADYGFFIPSDSSGKQVILDGKLQIRELSRAEQDHYARDLGDETTDGAAAPKMEYSIVATAVAIPVG